MNLPPASFSTIGGISGLNEAEIKQAWQDLGLKTNKSFLLWLADNTDLSDDQLQALYQKGKAVLQEKTSEQNLLELILPYLNKDQQNSAQTQYSTMFLANLQQKYAAWQNQLTPEQKQVFNSYLKTQPKP